MKKRLPLGYSYREDRNKYQCRFFYRGERYYVYGETIDECEQKKSEKLELLKNGLNVDSRNITLRQYYNIWIEEQKKVVKDSSIYTIGKYWKYIDDSIGKTKIADIQKQDIIYMQNVLQKKYSADTVNRAHKLLTQILNEAISDRIINFNPARSVRKLKSTKPKARDTNHRALSLEEQEAFFEYAQGKYYYNLFSFLVNTGMRVGEALALTWKDIDFKKREITINKTVMRTGDVEYAISESPKTSSSNRKIPLTQQIENILRAQMEQNKKIKAIEIDGLIFITAYGKMGNYNNVNSAIVRVLNAMREDGIYIEHFSVHAFRDTFATRCIEQGMPPIVLKELLGHSSLKMTMDIYAHVLPNTKYEELNKIEIAI